MHETPKAAFQLAFDKIDIDYVEFHACPRRQVGGQRRNPYFQRQAVQSYQIFPHDLRPGNRYRLKVAKGFRWLPHGPVMEFFRKEVLHDYFAGGFDGESEMLMVVHGEIGRGLANSFRERLMRIGQDFSKQHLADQKLPPDQRRPYTTP